jgi:sugar phosphate isomerase/epimerase
MTNPIAISTWSVQKLLETMPLEQLPAAMIARGFNRVEICHFHLRNQQPDYLQNTANIFRDAGVTIQTLLIDDGDITNPTTRDRNLKWIADWIEAAAHLRAENARVIAGKSAISEPVLQLSIEGLRALSKLGAKLGVRIVTENWFETLSTPQAVHHVLDAVGPDLGFLADTGNWQGATKYQDLQSIFARAELCHAKTSFSAGLVLDEVDNAKWLAAAKAANYQGPYTLIFADDGDEWDGLKIERDFIQQSTHVQS